MALGCFAALCLAAPVGCCWAPCPDCFGVAPSGRLVGPLFKRDGAPPSEREWAWELFCLRVAFTDSQGKSLAPCGLSREERVFTQ